MKLLLFQTKTFMGTQNIYLTTQQPLMGPDYVKIRLNKPIHRPELAIYFIQDDDGKYSPVDGFYIIREMDMTPLVERDPFIHKADTPNARYRVGCVV